MPRLAHSSSILSTVLPHGSDLPDCHRYTVLVSQPTKSLNSSTVICNSVRAFSTSFFVVICYLLAVLSKISKNARTLCNMNYNIKTLIISIFTSIFSEKIIPIKEIIIFHLLEQHIFQVHKAFDL